MGNLLIRDLRQRGTKSIQDMHSVNTDALSYRNMSPEKCNQTAEKWRKKKYLESYHQQRCNFYSFVVSMYSLLGVETEATLEHTDIRLAKKWKQPYSQMCGYSKSRVATTLVRATHPMHLGLLGIGAQDQPTVT